MGASIKGLVFGRQGRDESVTVVSIAAGKDILSVGPVKRMRNNSGS
jgi:hypothetical protein